MGKRIVVKVGSNVLTRKNGTLDVTRMSALVDQIADLREMGYQVVLVSSGAVASGRSELGNDVHLDSVEQRQLYSAVGQAKLMNRYYEFFKEHQIAVGQILTTKENFSTEEQYINQRNCLEIMLEKGVLPIVNENDTVSITELMFTDNDELSGLMATMCKAEALYLLSNIDGVYNGVPTDPASSVIREVAPGHDLSEYIQTSKSTSGRGGMTTKAGTAQAVAAQGIDVFIANGEREHILTDLITCPDDVPFTHFMAASIPVADAKSISEAGETGEGVDCKEALAEDVRSLLQQAQEASREQVRLSEGDVNELLLALADAIEGNISSLLEANAKDLARMDPANPKYDRLKLTDARLRGIAQDMRNTAALPSPLHLVQQDTVLPNGLHLQRVSAPFGVIGVIYEARPNVSFDVFSLCFKSGSACVLKGGSDAVDSNTAIVRLIRCVLEQHGVNPNFVSLLPASHEATGMLLNAREYVDLLIPRGSRRLIDFVRQNASIPFIETGAGICHTYFDKDGDLQMGSRIVCNAKTRRVSVCNALDCLLVHKQRISDVPVLCASLAEHNVIIYADPDCYKALQGKYPDNLLLRATEESFGTEFLDYKMAIRAVDSLDEALTHIARFSSKHSECIISGDEMTISRFQNEVDAACVYANAPTSFTDGAQFGLGAEIGISTQKLHARGPMALKEITTYKWIVRGNGQVRSNG